MNDFAIFGFGDSIEPAGKLADALDAECRAIMVRHFPDGESLVRVAPAPTNAILYRSLDHPNAKLVELLLAASALRDNGAKQVILVAPYLAYMRQDMAFQPGEAISQKVIGTLLADHFNGLVTVDPHLHRINRLEEAVPGISVVSLSAAPLLATAIDVHEQPIVIGPDSESRQWVEAIAAPLGLDVLIGRKQRNGDRAVEVELPDIAMVQGRPVVLVDDLISSGATLATAASLLLTAGAAKVEALATHCLASEPDLARMRAAGISQITATETIPCNSARLSVAGILAEAILARGWCATVSQGRPNRAPRDNPGARQT